MSEEAQHNLSIGTSTDDDETDEHFSIVMSDDEKEDRPFYFYNAQSPRTVEDAACDRLSESLRGKTRQAFCRDLLLGNQDQTIPQWPVAHLDGPVCMSVLHQQILQPRCQQTNRLWVLLGDRHTTGVRCGQQLAHSQVVHEFVELICQNVSNCVVDLMIEEKPRRISGGAPRMPVVDCPLTECSSFFRECNHRSFQELHNLTNEIKPECYKYMVRNNVRVTYVDPRHNILLNHPSRWQHQTDEFRDAAAKLRAVSSARSAGEFFDAMHDFVDSIPVPHDDVTKRRVLRLKFYISFTGCPSRDARTDEGRVTFLANLWRTVLQDIMPIVFYMTPLIQSQLEYIDEPHKSIILHAFRASAWEGRLIWPKHLPDTIFREVLRDTLCVRHRGTVFSSVSRTDLVSSLKSMSASMLFGSMDMYIICRSLRRWNTKGAVSRNRDCRYGAAPHIPCVIVLFAGAEHIFHLKSILPRLGPTDVLYTIPETPGSQCLFLAESHVCKMSDQSVGTLQYYRSDILMKRSV